MQIYVGRDGDQWGPYSLEQVQQHLAQGRLLITDSAWHEGLDSWIPLSQIPGVVVAPPRRPIALRPRKNLNKAQKVVLVAGLLVAVGMVYYPPWEGWDILDEGLFYPEHHALETIYGPNVMGSGEGVFSVYEFHELSTGKAGFDPLAEKAFQAFGMRFIVMSDTYVRLYRAMGGSPEDRESFWDYLTEKATEKARERGFTGDENGLEGALVAFEVMGEEFEGEFIYAVTEIAVGRLLFQLLLVSMCTLLLVVTFRGKQGRVDPAGQSDSPGRPRPGTGGGGRSLLSNSSPRPDTPQLNY